MKLIQCSHCHRPYYDNNPQCPYCGQDTITSSFNVVTRAVSDPESHRRMEKMLSPDYVPGTPLDETPKTTVKPSLQEETPEKNIEQDTSNEERIEDELNMEAAQERAEAITAVTEDNKEESVQEDDEDNHSDVDTTPLPKKKRCGWIWIIVIVVVVALAAVGYLKKDAILSMLPNAETPNAETVEDVTEKSIEDAKEEVTTVDMEMPEETSEAETMSEESAEETAETAEPSESE